MTNKQQLLFTVPFIALRFVITGESSSEHTLAVIVPWSVEMGTWHTFSGCHKGFSSQNCIFHIHFLFTGRVVGWTEISFVWVWGSEASFLC